MDQTGKMDEVWLKNLENREYEIQHFGFFAALVTYERKLVLRQLLNSLLESLCDKLSDKPDVVALLKTQIATCIENIFEEFKEDLIQLEKMDNENFSIPPHVLLPTDAEHEKSITDEMEKELEAEIKTMEEQVLDSTMMIEKLKMELADFEAIAPFLKEQEQIHEQLEAALRDINMEKLEKVFDTTKVFVEKGAQIKKK